MLGRLVVCLCPIKAKTTEPIGPNFVWDFTCPQGEFKDDQNFKNLLPTKYDFD